MTFKKSTFKIFTIGVLASGLMTVASNTSFSKTRQSLMPNTNWAVSKLDTTKADGGYCALARRFDTGVILTIAQNKDQKGSVAIDFQKNVLDIHQKYEIKLDTVNTEVREFSVTPVSRKAIVLKLGQDTDFYQALENTGTLDVDLGIESYTFNLNDFADGRAQLENCLLSLNGAGTGTAETNKAALNSRSSTTLAKSTGVEPDAKIVTQYESRITKLENTIRNREAKIAALEAQVQGAEAKSIRNEGSQSQIAELKSENASLQAALNSLQQERDAQKASYEQQLSLVEKNITNSEISVQNLEKQFQKTINTLQSDLDKKDEIISSLQEFQDSSDLQQAADDTAQIEKLAILQSKLDARNNEITKLRDALSNKQSELALASRPDDETQSLIEEVSRMKVALAQKEDAHKDLVLSLKTALGARDKKIKELQESIDVLQDKSKNKPVASLSDKHDVEQAKQQIASLKSALIEKEKALVSATEKLSRVTNQTPDTSVIDGFKTALADKDQDLLEKDKEIVSLQKALTEQRSLSTLSSKEETALKQQNQELRNQIDSYETQISSLTSKVQGQQSGLTSENKRLAQTLASTKAELSRARDTHEQQILKLETKIKAQDQQLVDLAAKTTDASDKNKTIAELKQRLDDLFAEKTISDNQIETALADNKALEDELTAVKDEFSNTKAELIALKNTESSADEKLQADLSLAQKALKTQREQYQTLVSDLQNQIRQQGREIVELESQSAASLNSISPAAGADISQADYAKLSALENQLEILKTENEAMRKTIEDGVDRIEISEALSTLNQLRTLQTKYDSLVQERNSLKDEIVELRGNVEQGRLNMASNDMSLESITRQYNEAERQLRTMGSRVEQVQKQCEREKQELEYKLFDPKIAKTEQLTRLIQLERQLMESRERWNNEKQAYEQRLTELGAPGLPYQGKAIISSAKVQPNNSAFDQSPDMDVAAAGFANMAPAAGTPSSVVARSTLSSEGGYNGPIGTLNEMSIGRLLGTVNVVPNNGIRKVSADDDDAVSYRWDTGKLFGSAEQKPIESMAQFDNLTNRYLKKIQNRCKGDFAAVPILSKDMGSERVASYDIACVGTAGSASASIVFFNQDGKFTTVAHESGVNDMSQAMDIRDRIVGKLVK